ncbi:MAG: hypothetical protein WDN06_22745 [Asticcacaulis sp.]
MSRYLVLAATAALMLTACTAPLADQAAYADPAKIGGQRCKVATDIARAVGADNYDPALKEGGNCQAEFAAAGIPMLGLKKPGDPDGAPGLDHITRLGPITRLDGATVKVGMDYVCPRLCGHGEEIIATLRLGAWTISSRKTTWIS